MIATGLVRCRPRWAGVVPLTASAALVGALAASTATAYAQAGGPLSLVAYMHVPGLTATTARTGPLATAAKGDELLTSFTLASTVPHVAGVSGGVVPVSSQATASMPIDGFSAQLLSVMAEGKSLSEPVEVDLFQAPDFRTKSQVVRVLSYQFSGAYFSSYSLNDAKTGGSVQVTFGYQRLHWKYSGPGNSATGTYNLPHVVP